MFVYAAADQRDSVWPGTTVAFLGTKGMQVGTVERIVREGVRGQKRDRIRVYISVPGQWSQSIVRRPENLLVIAGPKEGD